MYNKYGNTKRKNNPENKILKQKKKKTKMSIL